MQSEESSLRPGPALAPQQNARCAPRPGGLLSARSSSSSSQSGPESPPRAPRPRGAPGSAPRGASAFYTRVRTVRSVAVAWETEAGFEPVGGKPRVHEAEFIAGQSGKGSAPGVAAGRAPRPDPEAPESARAGQGGAEGPGSPGSRAREPPDTPDWLVTAERGLRCVACCRVFPALAALREHVERGAQEGFSCRVFFEKMRQRRRARGPEQDEGEQSPADSSDCPRPSSTVLPAQQR